MRLKKTIKVLLNPSSGGGNSLKKIHKVKKCLKKLSNHWHIIITKSEDHFREEAGRIGENEILLVAGGDSSLLMAVEELKKKNNLDISIAFMPLGSANDIGKALNIKNISSAVKALNRGEETKWDMGTVKVNDNEKEFCFLGSLSFGLGSEINSYIAKNIQGKSKNWTLFLAVLGAYKAFSLSKVPLKYSVIAGKKRQEFQSSLGLFLNAPYYANGLDFSQIVCPKDNYIDFFSFNNKSFFSALSSFISLKFTKNYKKISHLRGEEFCVKFPKSSDIQIDGEIIENVKSFSVKILKEKVSLCTL